jgi:2,4'-dihydroxyacetophenone dioxygenase
MTEAEKRNAAPSAGEPGGANPELARSSPWSLPDLILEAVPEDERLWVPMGEGVWVRPLMFDTAAGAWVNVMRTERAGVISRHRHACPVHGYVLDGSWRYLEQDWVARPGSYLYEPAGDTHTLCIEEPGVGHTLFWIGGAMLNVDDDGRLLGYADVFTRIAEARRHYEAVGLGAELVDQMIR